MVEKNHLAREDSHCACLNLVPAAAMLAQLPIRQLVLNRCAPAKDVAKCFSVMTFNVLAQCYTRSEVPSYPRTWKECADS